jgi:hypothetical protein
MNELLQKSGKNWRKFTLQSDAVVYESCIHGNTSSKRLPFDQVGSIGTDYEYLTQQEYRYPLAMRRVIFGLSFVVAATCFGLSGALEQPAGHMTIPSVILVIAGWTALLAAVSAILLQSRKVRLKRIFFASGGYMTFYARDNQDADQIESFSAAFAKSELAHLKENFLREIETNPAGLERLLNHLSEKSQFTSKEYRTYLQMIQKAEKKTSSKTKKK